MLRNQGRAVAPTCTDWDGVIWDDPQVGGKIAASNSHLYSNAFEVELAEMLIAQGVPFTSHVRIPLGSAVVSGRGEECYCPDFVFNGQLWLWAEDPRQPIPIHGLEAKGRIGRIDRAKQAALRSRRGIEIAFVMNNSAEFYRQNGGLPLRPFGEIRPRTA
jgi:hypothetical protein